MFSQLHGFRLLGQRRFLSTASSRLKTLGIRSEDKNRWERRVALTPQHVESLIKETGAKVLVQRSNNRVFTNARYEKAGAILKDDLSEADVILGIKEVPQSKLIAGKTYVYFSHTHKGQPYNMPMLQNVLDKKIRLIDYELITNDAGARLVLFGTHAGYAGMINCLHGVGQRLLGFGYNTPFLYVGMAHNYQSLADAKSTIQKVGKIIAEEGLPREFGPVVFTFTGSGSVSKGAQDVFASLPHEYVKASELEKLIKSKDFDNKKIYACEVTFADYIQKKDGGPVERDDYFKNPENYTSNFHKSVAPYTTALVNGLFWSNEYPRLLTNQQLAEIQADDANKYRLVSIADISCDIEGSLEFTTKTTTIDEPFFYYDAINSNEHQDIEHTGTQIMSIDNLPTEIPAESSQHFSGAFYPFAKELVMGKFDHPVLERATIAENGELTPKHKHLQKKLTSGSGIVVKSNEKRRVLLLGSGFVSAPLIDYFLRDKSTEVTIASNQLSEATALAKGRENTRVKDLQVQDPEKLAGLVNDSDVVVSFVPAPFHPAVAQACIAQRKNMVTASYISPAMKALDQQAKQAGVSIINEIGLDPGIDHLTAMKIIDEVKEKGGRVTSFISWCGGLPAPECSDNPLGYKFSWSPRGVLTAGLNDAQFKMNGKLHTIPGSKLLASYFPSVPIFPGFAFEGLANRDSLQYVDTYGLGPVEELDTMFRGTLRFKGYSDLMYAFGKLGMLSQKANPQEFDSWVAFLDSVLGNNSGDHNSRLSKISQKLELPQNHPMVGRVLSGLSWLQMTKEANSTALPKIRAPTVLDGFCTILSNQLQYGAHERDMVALHHEFGVERSDGSKEIHKSTLITYGTVGGYSGMAKTVALPAAIAADLLLKGKVSTRGVLSPTISEIYKPVLDSLNTEGIEVIEEVNKGARSIKEQLSWAGNNYW
ncbi:hypothetical protein K493DRAFT_42596 [Basidiobolus meristosporus CBS 931.73]|uniref:Uncharacterized protein n=2 Tax=Basidiobolus meristosporus CBS 931.73 TaxID=1314790 RepID=A0A1Y1Z607_9FUNG|nr:hypothetical protein K493DRAFT_42596 [Basidiobolus meristosporus CBS 931.73]|eukprot:ORY05235.1 hypothetical protein K493DRAFT_42596 [Basidiobolus meristosporus CBS 931.73]